MDYEIKQDRGAWVFIVLEGEFAGQKHRFSSKRALISALDRLRSSYSV